MRATSAPRPTVRLGTIIVLLTVAAACSDSGPVSPTATNPRTIPAPSPVPVRDFPPLFGPSRTFVFDRELSYPVSAYTKASRFVLYDNGAFVLNAGGMAGSDDQDPERSQGGPRGRYTDAHGVISFEWVDSSPAGPWGATGILTDDSLTVRYNSIMWASDFEDAVYVLMR